MLLAATLVAGQDLGRDEPGPEQQASTDGGIIGRESIPVPVPNEEAPSESSSYNGHRPSRPKPRCRAPRIDILWRCSRADIEWLRHSLVEASLSDPEQARFTRLARMSR